MSPTLASATELDQRARRDLDVSAQELPGEEEIAGAKENKASVAGYLRIHGLSGRRCLTACQRHAIMGTRPPTAPIELDIFRIAHSGAVH
jgi:hypothetical protein